ncbi:hypothetical protein SGLAM104S_06460 [Streptomyces glaucescens]
MVKSSLLTDAWSSSASQLVTGYNFWTSCHFSESGSRSTSVTERVDVRQGNHLSHAVGHEAPAGEPLRGRPRIEATRLSMSWDCSRVCAGVVGISPAG